MADGLLSTYNYIVPAAGTTHGYRVSQTFSATPFRVDFRDVSISGQQFIPSGLFIDNTQGTGPITLTFLETGYRVQCAAGQAFQTQYPASAAQTVAITGLGNATVIFVDFPVIPFVNAGGTAATVVNIPDGNDVAIGARTDTPATDDTGTFSLIALFKRLLQKIPGIGATGTQSSIAGAAADTLLLAANAARKGATIYNDSTATLYVLLSTGVSSATNFSLQLGQGQSLILSPGDYTGQIRGIWSAAAGSARITEIV